LDTALANQLGYVLLHTATLRYSTLAFTVALLNSTFNEPCLQVMLVCKKHLKYLSNKHRKCLTLTCGVLGPPSTSIIFMHEAQLRGACKFSWSRHRRSYQKHLPY